MPEAHIRGDINTPYRCIGGAIFTMQRAGFARVGFISEPARGAARRRACRFRSLSQWRCKPPVTNHGEPMMDINTTPLIDVMLVLLIMFIITIPIQTHAVKLDLPADQHEHAAAADRADQEQGRDHREGQMLWNGEAGQLEQLRQYLDLSQQINPIPELHLQPDPDARYELVDEVLAVTKRAHVEKMGFVGNEAYMKF